MRNGTRTVDDHDLLRGLFLRERIEDQVDCFTKHHTVRADLFRGTNVQIGDGIRLDVVEDVPCELLRVATGLEVLNSALDGDNIVTVRATLNVRDLAILFVSDCM